MIYLDIEFRDSKLTQIASQLGLEVGEAVREETEVEKAEAQRRCPYDTGELHDSHMIVGPFHSDGTYSCGIAVTAPHALPVHERLDVHHPHGEAKWLERTLSESRRYVGQRIAARIRRALEALRAF